MIVYVSIGTNDRAAARRFYLAVLPALGYALEERSDGLSFTQPAPPGHAFPPPDFYVKSPFDGQPASTGNGTMVAFEAANRAQVRELHAAGLAAGGRDEGAPGYREAYGPRFFVAYLRDPDGNKLALFSSNDDERRSDDEGFVNPTANLVNNVTNPATPAATPSASEG